jgi:2,4-dienoyl-CoA reductase-like NADH-dependent reductase (Old Yellow Enzyme family)
MEQKMPLLTGIRIGRKSLPNRIAINAMECCDADTGGNPTHTAFRRYERLARGNAGMIVVEALSVVDENLGRQHQLTALPQNQKGLTDLVSAMRRANPKPLIVWQLTHNGELANPEFSERVCVKPFPGYEGRLLTEEEVDGILDKFVTAAKMAHDCGADGVDLKLCHGYLGSQLLRPFNDRKWKYGGSWANRARFAYEFYERVATQVKDPDFCVGSKVTVWEGLPGGQGGGPRAHQRRGVGHGAHDAHPVAHLSLDGGDGDAGGDGDDQLRGVERRGDLLEELVHRLRLHREEHDGRLARRLGVALAEPHAVALDQLGPALGPAVGAEDLLGAGDAGPEQPLHQRLGHVAGAEEGDGLPEWHAGTLDDRARLGNGGVGTRAQTPS